MQARQLLDDSRPKHDDEDAALAEMKRHAYVLSFQSITFAFGTYSWKRAYTRLILDMNKQICALRPLREQLQYTFVIIELRHLQQC